MKMDSGTVNGGGSGANAKHAGMKMGADETGPSGNTSMSDVADVSDKPGVPGVGEMEDMDLKPRVTLPQLLAVTLLTILALGGGVVLAAFFGNFSMSPRDMQNGSVSGMSGMSGLIMPSGMIMEAGMNDDAMRGMAAVDPSQITYTAPANAATPLVGLWSAQLTDYHTLRDRGVRVFSGQYYCTQSPRAA